MNVLQEIAKLGADQAATALSGLLSLPVGVQALKTVQATLPEIADFQPTPGTEVCVGIWFSLHGEQAGNAVLVVSRADACRLVDVADRKPIGSTTILDDYAQSVIREIGNIMAGAFFLAARKLVPTVLVHSIPRLIVDQWHELVGSLLSAMQRKDEPTALLECELLVKTVDARCVLIIWMREWTEDGSPAESRGLEWS
jgi:chemotaxis protein CheC